MIIRKAKLEDYHAIADLLFLAMEDLIYNFIGVKDKQKAKDFLIYFTQKTNNQYSYENCLVLEVENEISAAINIYYGSDILKLRKPIELYIKKNYNLEFNPENESEEGDYYIDSLGVKENQQGKGLGSKLLDFVINEFVKNKNLTLGLLVDYDNPNAKTLYLRKGFKVIKSKTIAEKQFEYLQINKSILAESTIH